MEEGIHPPRLHLRLEGTAWREKVVGELSGFPIELGTPPGFSEWPTHSLLLADTAVAMQMAESLENTPGGLAVINATLVLPPEPLTTEQRVYFFQRGFAYVCLGDFPALRKRLQDMLCLRSTLLAEKAVNRRLRQYLRTQQAVFTNQGDFLNMAVHDLRGPLAAMICYAELLMEGVLGNLQSSQLDPIRTIHRNCQFLIDMVNDLLDSARIGSGKLALNLEQVDFPKEVANAAQALRSLADTKRITLRLEAEEIPPMFLDAQKVGRILSNLLGNAIKFSRMGGEIVLRSSRQGNSLVFSIQDTGPGITETDRRAIFEKFRTGSRSDIAGKGHGLGLHICKSFVELHGGRIYVESARHKGSVFILHLPLEKRRSRLPTAVSREVQIIDLCGDVPALDTLAEKGAPGMKCTIRRLETAPFLMEKAPNCDFLLVNEASTPFGEKFLLLHLAELGIPCGLLVPEGMPEGDRDLRRNMGFWLQTKPCVPGVIFDKLQEIAGLDRRRRPPKSD